MNTGIAWHEGQLFGWINQLIGVLTATLLISISVLGVVMWLKRRPQGQLGGPEAVTGAPVKWVFLVLLGLALLLPLFGLSVVLLLIVDAARRLLVKPIEG